MTTPIWFMKRHRTQKCGNLKTRAELGRPDTQQAEQWLTPDFFLYRGHVWEVLLDGRVIKLNGGVNAKEL